MGTVFRTETVSGTALAAGMGRRIRPAASVPICNSFPNPKRKRGTTLFRASLTLRVRTLNELPIRDTPISAHKENGHQRKTPSMAVVFLQ